MAKPQDKASAIDLTDIARKPRSAGVTLGAMLGQDPTVVDAKSAVAQQAFLANSPEARENRQLRKERDALTEAAASAQALKVAAEEKAVQAAEREAEAVQKAKNAEIEMSAAQSKAAQFDGALLTRQIDPKLIHPSKWANRDEASFHDAAFEALKKDIENSGSLLDQVSDKRVPGGNVQPIKVRPHPTLPGEYEIIFGHRRHRACLDLGLLVLATIEDATDQELFAEMDRENRQRADLRPYEQGVMYRNALRSGLFPSNRKMAEALSVDLSNLGKYISLADLPKPILDAFPSALDVQLGWATKLKQLLEKDADLLLVRSKEIKKDPKRNAKQVMEFLQGGGVVSNHPPTKVVIEGKRGQTGMIRFNPIKNKFAIELAGIDRERIGELEKLVQGFLDC